MNYSGIEDFCRGQFWNGSQLLDNSWPEFTPCFVSTVLVWVPCGYVWLLLPYFLYDVHNPQSTNNLHLAIVDGGGKAAASKSRTSGSSVGNGGPCQAAEQPPRGTVTTVCVLKIILTSVLAALWLVQLLFNIKDFQPTSEIVAAAMYLGTYILVALQLWYERIKGRNAFLASFYFYAMNSVVGVVPLYTMVITETSGDNPGKFTILVLSLAINVLNFVLAFVPDNHWANRGGGYRRIGSRPCPEATAGYPSQMLFLWMLKLMMSGFKREITADDVWDLNPRDQGHRLNARFEKRWAKEINRVDKMNRSSQNE